MAINYDLDKLWFGTNRVQPLVRPKIRRAEERVKGCAAVVVGGFVFLFAGVTVQMSERIPALHFMFVQCSFGALAMLVVLLWTRQPLLGPPRAQFYVIVRSLVGGLSMCLFFLALQWLPLAHAVSLFAANTAIAYLNNWIVLEEPLRVAHVFSIILGLLGTVFIVRPGLMFEPRPNGAPGVAPGTVGDFGSTTETAGLIVAVLSAVTAGVQLAPLRQAELFSASRTSIAFAQSVSGALCALLASSLVPGQEIVAPKLDLKEVVSFSVVVWTGLVFEACSIYAAERAEEKYRLTMTSFQIMWAWAWQIAFFHQMSDLLVLFGSGAMLVSVCVSCLVSTQDHESSVTTDTGVEKPTPRAGFHVSSQHTTLLSNDFSSTYSSREFHSQHPPQRMLTPRTSGWSS